MEPEELAELQQIMTKAAEEIEGRLADSLNKAIEGINKKIDLAVDLNVQSKAAFESVPALIQEQVEGQLTKNIKAIGEELSKQFEEKVKAMAGGGGGGGGAGGAPGDGFSLNFLLANSDKIVGIVNAFRSPTTDQAMAGQMATIFKWHGLLSKIEKGGVSGDELTNQIAATFNPPKQE